MIEGCSSRESRSTATYHAANTSNPSRAPRHMRKQMHPLQPHQQGVPPKATARQVPVNQIPPMQERFRALAKGPSLARDWPLRPIQFIRATDRVPWPIPVTNWLHGFPRLDLPIPFSYSLHTLYSSAGLALRSCSCAKYAVSRRACPPKLCEARVGGVAESG